ncbi:MAG: hemolysin family protein [Gemmatimonadota bacterium]|jgi:CBS domain containing-hemolysin-like protein
MTQLAWVLAFTLGTSFLCSVLEATLLSITISYTETLKERGERAGHILWRFQRNIDEPIAAILTLNTVANTAGATLAGALALDVFGSAWMAAFSAALTLSILLFSEIVPKTLGATFWTILARPAAYVLQGMVWGLKPVILPLRAFARLITPRSGRPSEVTRAELEVLATLGRRQGTLDEAEWKVVTNVMRLEDVRLGEVMTPRTDIVAVPVDATVEEAKDVMLDHGHLRLPVYDETLDGIRGILLARDLWDADRAGATHIGDLVRPAVFAPATKSVEALIPELRRQRMKMAIVVDEFGGTAGIVTLEDLLEEIVGEIQDEHEADEPVAFQPLEGGGVRVWGAVSVREANERFGVALPDDRHDTIGGWISGELNRIGQVGDVVQVEGGSFRITEVHGRRVEYLVFERRG